MTAGRIAVDAMGGDHAPEALVAGALEAAHAGWPSVLVGDASSLKALVAELGGADLLEVHHAPEVVGMDEEPAIALRAKRHASVRVAARLVADGSATGMVSAGSTGATLVAATLEIGRLPGVRRPAIGAVLPVGAHGVVLVDAGASADADARALTGYASLGAAYAKARGIAQPRVGLLNVGAESGKGSAVVRQAGEEFARHVDSFVGNVEPGALLAGACDVVVAEGFIGNVFLKTLEACVQAGTAAVDDSSPSGGAPLLGVAGTVVVAHGGADARSVAAAIETAATLEAARLSPEEQR